MTVTAGSGLSGGGQLGTANQSGASSISLSVTDAPKWTTARTLSLTGDASGSVSWDGSANATLSVTVANDSHTHDTLYMRRDTPSLTSNINTIESKSEVVRWNNVTTGRPASGQTNEYGPLLQMAYDGNVVSQLSHDFAEDNLYFRKLTTSSDTGTTWKRLFHDGYHPNADKWTTARTLSLSGDASGSTSWDGSGNASISVTVANNSHSHVPSNISGLIEGTSFSGEYPLLMGIQQSPARIFSESSITFRGSDSRLAIDGNTVWHGGNDGSGSGLDADLLDGLDSTAFVRSKDRTNWNTSPSVIGDVIGQLAWKNYSNNHTIFDASASTTPNGGSCNNTNSDYAWSGTYPTLMGWNGSNTYGVRVDSARNADNAALLGSLPLTSQTRNSQANSVVRTQSNGYCEFGWINTVSGDTSSSLSRIFVDTGDGYIRKSTLAHVASQLPISAGAPAGSIIYHAASSAPSGFIKANGASLSTSTYADLFAAIGYTYGGSGGSFNVPDLRGEFLRGWDDSRGVDSGRSFGSYQADDFGSHSHTAYGAFSSTWFSVYARSGNWGSERYITTNSYQTATTGSADTRPRNRALLACIKI